MGDNVQLTIASFKISDYHLTKPAQLSNLVKMIEKVDVTEETHLEIDHGQLNEIIHIITNDLYSVMESLYLKLSHEDFSDAFKRSFYEDDSKQFWEDSLRNTDTVDYSNNELLWSLVDVFSEKLLQVNRKLFNLLQNIKLDEATLSDIYEGSQMNGLNAMLELIKIMQTDNVEIPDSTDVLNHLYEWVKSIVNLQQLLEEIKIDTSNSKIMDQALSLLESMKGYKDSISDLQLSEIFHRVREEVMSDNDDVLDSLIRYARQTKPSFDDSTDKENSKPNIEKGENEDRSDFDEKPDKENSKPSIEKGENEERSDFDEKPDNEISKSNIEKGENEERSDFDEKPDKENSKPNIEKGENEERTDFDEKPDNEISKSNIEKGENEERSDFDEKPD